ncbi:hypothetical protein NE237_006016 [Protea cynaroides]|uniref:Uncharacterized protein n=1 Tax=Protea cynaroides TaxID=273540 RepID=A0A9Q0KLQ7_9MAGN|nr:hypothetical protein NE237_006016 [Protea cynaroides]
MSFPQHLTQATYLRKLMVWNCPKLTWKPSPASSHFPFLHIEELILKEDAGSFSKSLIPNNHHIFLPKLKLLRVRKSPYFSLPQGFGKLTSLEILDIRTSSDVEGKQTVAPLSPKSFRHVLERLPSSLEDLETLKLRFTAFVDQFMFYSLYGRTCFGLPQSSRPFGLSEELFMNVRLIETLKCEVLFIKLVLDNSPALGGDEHCAYFFIHNLV